MAPTPRSEHHVNLDYLPQLTSSQPQSGSSTAATSPIEPATGPSARFPLPTSNGHSSMSNPTSTARLGAGSPSHEFGARLFSKRAREIQAQEGLLPQVWGPPASGTSTPLRETIPESPNGETFPDFEQPSADITVAKAPIRRGRAGTLPSRFSPANSGLAPQQSLLPNSSRPSPSASPFRPGPSTPTELGFGNATSAAAKSALLSRLRAGSMPQRANLLGSTQGPFGSSVFSPGWPNLRERTVTLQSIPSNGPASPARSSFSRDSLADTDVKTLDYLGLVDTPQQNRATLAPSGIELLLESQRVANSQPGAAGGLANFSKNVNRFRSYSVNAKEKYAEIEDEVDQVGQYPSTYSGSLTPTADAHVTALAVHEAVRQHNLEVQAFANLASASRPRARTAGVLDSPSTRLYRSFLPTASRLDNTLNASDLGLAEESEYEGLVDAVRGMHLNGKPMMDITGDDTTLEGPTRALWLGNIPSSTTVSSLNVIFSNFGAIESTRVLTHKNCGFVNFENLESAIRARAQLNNKEIFPGAGPVRIGYAKVPSATDTPGHGGAVSSPSPDPLAHGQNGVSDSGSGNASKGRQADGTLADGQPTVVVTPVLAEVRSDIIDIVKDLGASDEERKRIAVSVDKAIEYDHYESEIPPIAEPNHNRVHDAPRLREIRKRIDNNACSQAEIEEIAMGMLPEIAELSSDYLGNTVVQKLFEYCSEKVKEAMLHEIAPHLAEIGVHKNGTWAAQKIIDVARTPTLMTMVVESLRPYGVALFLDQFGNYVMQGCLRYQYPLNNFIFDVMLSRLWDLAQGRFGARAMRACLESHYATKDQQRMIAAAIAIHSVQLATNANGALLLTWFLDTCTFPRRRTVLAPRLVPHLVQLCTHKVAYLTVLKIINQRNEPEARDTILQALFFSPNDQVLEDILSDQSCGATLIFKVLTTPFFDEKIRADVVQNIRNVLLRIKAQPAQGYKRLMDEVGLSTRNAGPGGRDVHNSRELPDSSRPGSKNSNGNGHLTQAGPEVQMNRQFFPAMAQQPFDASMNIQRSGSVDSTGYEQFPINGMNPALYASNANIPLTGNPINPQQMQYQQAMLAASTRPGSFYPNSLGGVNAFPIPSPSVDAFRGNPGLGSSPMMAPQPGFSQQGFPPALGPQVYGYPLQYPPAHQQAHAQAAGMARRARR